jgi:hypothetical protein
VLIRFKGKRLWWIILGIVLGMVAVWTIYKKLSQDITQDSWRLLLIRCQNPHTLILLACAGLLMPFNWGFEAVKWKMCLSQVQYLNFRSALKSVCSGIFTGFFIPGRLSEFLGKIEYIQVPHKASAIALHGILGQIQYLITLSIGCLAFLLNGYPISPLSIGMGLACIGGSVALLSILFKYQHVFIKHLQRFFPNQSALPSFVMLSTLQVRNIIGVSVLRYIIFSLQLGLVLCAFIPQNAVTDLIYKLPVYFLITSTVPMISIFEPAIRSYLLLFVFQQQRGYTLELSLAVVLIWVLNLIIPAIYGYVALWKQKLK